MSPEPFALVTLLFLVEDGQVLLMRKKRGIGAGKINAPGGKADPGESALAAAVRETEEEVGVTPLDPEPRGELWFRFLADGSVLRCVVFLAHAHAGGPAHETDEAIPRWFPLDALPYDEMWDDDRLWLPLLLAGKRFRGEVTVAADGETTTEQRIEVVG